MAMPDLDERLKLARKPRKRAAGENGTTFSAIDRSSAHGCSRYRRSRGAGFNASPASYYVGINAQARKRFLHEPEVAKDLGEHVQAIIGEKARPSDCRMTAIVAEVQLIQRHLADAARLYGEAVAMEPARIDDHRSTFRRASGMLEDLAATPEAAAFVRNAFGHLLAQRDAQPKS